ncbi:hypothetical protein VNO78_23672 [Psophocarpus tetragonolobus]|uniref:Uncharacterized protein n=1 Tax=Psophocarpus tetragonolobus TaxID=3891 RepID=A0AAN9XE06_PSOTE
MTVTENGEKDRTVPRDYPTDMVSLNPFRAKRQQSEFVDPVPFLDPHQCLKLLFVFPFAPLPQIDNHNSVVKVAQIVSLKRRRVGRVRPEVM